MNSNWIKSLCQNKTIILFGNGTTNYSAKTDEVIVRMNHGIKAGKTNIWVNNLCQSEKIHKDLFRPDVSYILRLNGEMNGKRFLLNYPKSYEFIERTIWWTAQEWENMSKEMKNPRPLTGTIAAYWFLKYTIPKKLKVTGMDFFENSDNIYTGTTLTSVHNSSRDKIYFDKIKDKITYV